MYNCKNLYNCKNYTFNDLNINENGIIYLKYNINSGMYSNDEKIQSLKNEVLELTNILNEKNENMIIYEKRYKTMKINLKNSKQEIFNLKYDILIQKNN